MTNIMDSFDSNRLIMILAGSYEEFRELKEKHPTPELLRYIAEPISLVGEHNYSVVRIGTYWQRADIDKIEDEIKLESINRSRNNI